MNLLFKLDPKLKGFTTIAEAKDFFKNELPLRDNYFYNGKTILKIKMEDIIYFSLKGFIVAKAVFAGDIIENNDRDELKIGHKVKNVELVDSNKKIDFNIINGRAINYLDNDTKINEIKRVLNTTIDIYPDEVDESFSEGNRSRVYINKYERDPKARKACLEHFGYSCQICKFDFWYTYGDIGKGSIHVHHITPLSEMNKEYKIKPKEDLIPVCPNCHLILHKLNAPTIEELKERFR